MKSFLISIIATASIFLSLIITNFVCADTWEKSFGGSSEGAGVCVQQTNDGGYIVVGYIENSGGNNSDVWLVKFNQSGDVAWQKTFDNSNDDEGHWAQQTTDNGFIIVGETETDNGKDDIYLIKTDGIGNLSWSKTFGGENYEDAGTVQEISNGYLIGGDTSSYSPEEGYWILITDKNGNLLSDKIIGDPRAGSQGEAGKEVWQTADGGSIIIGQTDASGEDFEDLIKTNSSGIIEWWKRWGSSDDFYINSGKQTQDGGFIVTGEKGNWPNIKTYIEKIDANGNSDWNRELPGEGGLRILIVPNDGFAILCPSPPSLIKTTNNGHRQWVKTFLGNFSWRSNFAITNDGGYVIVSEKLLIYYKRPEGKGMNPAIPALLLSD